MSKPVGPNKYPCFKYPGGCPNRSPGCQSKCIEMLCAELEISERKKTAKNNRDNENNATGVVVRRYSRMTRRKLKER